MNRFLHFSAKQLKDVSTVVLFLLNFFWSLEFFLVNNYKFLKSISKHWGVKYLGKIKIKFI